jgi:hypothetical protein
MNRPKPPYIAQILFQNCHFYFYEADPTTQALRLIFKESYENVVRFKNSHLSSETQQ